MALPEQVLSLLGVSGTGVALATGIYIGAGQIENEMHPQAKKEMALFLKTRSLSHHWKIYHNLIRTVFALLFGERHLSLKCFMRSSAMTLFYIAAISVLFYFKNGTIFPNLFAAFVEPNPANPKGTTDYLLIPLAILVFTMLFSIIPDYVSLAKGRAILYAVGKLNKFRYAVAFIAIDVLLSFLISVSLIIFYAYVLKRFYSHSSWSLWEETKGIFLGVVQDLQISFTDKGVVGTQISNVKLSEAVMMSTYVTSTMLTSIWALMTLLSAVLMKIAAPVAYLWKAAAWFFDVDEHPLKALGSVMAAITLVGSTIYGLI
jgi:hypothetical protein